MKVTLTETDLKKALAAYKKGISVCDCIVGLAVKRVLKKNIFDMGFSSFACGKDRYRALDEKDTNDITYTFDLHWDKPEIVSKLVGRTIEFLKI